MRLVLLSAATLALTLSVLAPVAPVLGQDAITIAIRDGQFVPNEVQIPAGKKVELIIKNEQKKAAEFESHSLRREKVIAAGTTASVFVGPLQAGRHEFFDDFHPQTRGFLVVQ